MRVHVPALVLGLLASAAAVRAADVPLLGTKITVVDSLTDPAKRKLTFKSSDPTVQVGTADPTVTGATIEVLNPTPGLEQSAVFPLPAAGWLPIGSPPVGYKYKDSKLLRGPVKAAQVKNGKLVKFSAKGAGIAFALRGTPQGTIGVVADVGGTRFCTLFGGTITKDDGVKFSAKLAPAPALCPALPTTTTTAPPTTTSTSSTTSTTTSTSSSTTSSSSSSTSSTTSTSSSSSSSTTSTSATTTSSTSSTSTTTSTSTTSTTTTSTTSSTEPTTTTTTTTESPTTTTTSTSTTTTTAPAGLNLDSAVIATSACLTNGTGAQLAVELTLTDTLGAPVAGAAVSMTATAGTLGPVQSSGNRYWAILSAPDSGTSAQITVVANGETMSTSPVVALAAPFTDAAGGAGGCPQDGNLRLRVVDETGAPIAGASVLVGGVEQLNAYVTTYDWPADGATSATTDASGWAVFRDFGPALAGPVTVTAGAAGRQYLTVAEVDASDVVLALKPLVATAQTGTLSGDLTGISSSSNVRVGVVLGDVALDALASFDLNNLLSDSVCYNGGALVGNVAVPNNVFIPSQTLLFIYPLPKKSYVSAPLAYGQRRVIALGGNTPVSALTGGGGIAAALTQLTFTNITAQTLTVASPGPTPTNFAVSSYGSSTACTASGAPATDGFCIAALDWDGNTTPTHNVGEGPLGVFSFKTAAASGGAVNLTGVQYKAKGAAAPNPFTAVGHMGAAVSLNLDKSLTTIPPGTASGVSVVLKRDFPGDTFPATWDYGALYPIRVHAQAGRTLSLDSPPGLAGAGYVRHTLAQQISTPYTACAPNDSTRTQSNTLWEVYAPASTAAVTLPTLPASFPRAELGGNLQGLLDPALTLEDDKVTWASATIGEGLNPSFDYDRLRLSGFRRYGTHFTSNSADYLP